MKRIALALLLSGSLWATIPVTALWDIRSSATASNANAGGFDYGNASFPTDLACTSATGTAPVCSSASYNFVAGDVPKWLFVQSGTNWFANQMCPIASVASNQATLTATIGSCVIFANGRWSPTTVAGVASTGSPTAGVWGVDKSQQDAADASYTDLIVGVTTTQVTSVATPFNISDTGNSINETAGSGCTVQRVFIMSVSTITATLDSSAGTAASTCTAKKGGALSLGSSDDAIFELATASSSGNNRFFVKGSATYTIGGTVTISAAGNAVHPIVVEGYATVRGDRPTGSTRPLFDVAAAVFTYGTAWQNMSMQYTGTSASGVVTGGSSNLFLSVKATNTSTTAARTAITPGSSSVVLASEAISYRGTAMNCSSTNCMVFGSYLHDSDICMSNSGTSAVVNAQFDVFEGCGTNGYNGTGANTLGTNFNADLFYGSELQLGTGFKVAAGTTNIRFSNNILSGLATPANDGDSGQTVAYSDYNDQFNSGAVTNWNTGPHSVALDPQFTNVHQYVNLGTVSSSTNVLTDSGATFTNVADDVDFLYIISGTGTGLATGVYPIHTHTSTTLTLATPAGTAVNITTAGSGSAIVYGVTYGHNFAIGTNLKALGFPGVIGLSTGYMDIGPLQRQESSGGAKGFATIQ